MNAKSIKGKSPEEISSALMESMADGFHPSLAIVFLSVSQDRGAIVDEFNQKNISVFGMTTNGEFIDEVTEKNSVVALLLDLDKSYYRILQENYSDKNYAAAANKIAEKAKTLYRKPAFLLGLSHPAVDGEEVLNAFEDVFGEEVNAFGACAGDDYAFTETFVFTNDWESHEGMVCLVINEEKIKVKGIATCGWKGVGTEKTVTKSEGNHVFTIEGEPALDITTKYGGLENITPDSKNLLIELATNFPLQLQKEKGEPVMRPGLVIDWSDRSFFTSGKVPQGAKVRFSLPPDWDVMDKVIKGVDELKMKEMPEADALIEFSCAGRILAFGPMMSEEIEGVKKIWNVPMVGMFSNGELGRTKGGNLEMHNLTTCCVALKEK